MGLADSLPLGVYFLTLLLSDEASRPITSRSAYQSAYRPRELRGAFNSGPWRSHKSRATDVTSTRLSTSGERGSVTTMDGTHLSSAQFESLPRLR